MTTRKQPMWHSPYNIKFNNNNNNNNSNNNNKSNYHIIGQFHDHTQDDFYQNYSSDFPLSALSPTVFVIDFDETLAYYDEDYILQDGTHPMDSHPSFYTRPFFEHFLSFLKSFNKNNILILWTAGTTCYIYLAIFIMNIAPYFYKILSRPDCEESLKQYGYKKAHAYLISKYPTLANMKSVLIDDQAHTNGCNEYDLLINVAPYNSDMVKRHIYYISNVNSYQFIINRMKMLMKGRKKNKNSNNDTYGDCVLLNVMNLINEIMIE